MGQNLATAQEALQVYESFEENSKVKKFISTSTHHHGPRFSPSLSPYTLK